MSDESMVREYPDQKQRLAVGFSQWRQRHGKHKKIKEGQFNDHFWVVKEMQRRGILHKYEENVLDQETDDLLKVLSEESAPGLHEDIIDPDLKHLRDELLSLTIDRVLGLSDNMLQEYNHQAGLILNERDLQRVQDLLGHEIQRRELEKKKEKAEETDPVIKAYSIQEVLSLDQQETINKELDRIGKMPLVKQVKQLQGLWKSYCLGLKSLDNLEVISQDFPIRADFDRSRLVVLQNKKEEFQATFEITKVIKEERMIYGPVLIPEITDGQEDKVSAKEIRNAMWHYMDEHAIVGFMHSVQHTVEGIKGQVERAISMKYTVEQLYKGVPTDSMVPGISPVLAKPRTFIDKFKIREIYQAPVDFTLNNQLVRKGTWVMGIYVADEFLWEQVKLGKITGFSIGGESERLPI